MEETKNLEEKSQEEIIATKFLEAESKAEEKEPGIESIFHFRESVWDTM